MVQDVGRDLGFDPDSIYAGFPAWVGQQNPERAYNYYSNCGCAFAEFLTDPDIGIAETASVGGSYWSIDGGADLEFPIAIRRALVRQPWTFGALAARLAEQASA